MANFTPPKLVTMTVPAGGSRNIDGPGIFARITEANGPVRIGFDLGTPFNSAVGRSYWCGIPGERFSRIVIENPSATDSVTFSLEVGTMYSGDDRLHFVAGTDYLPVTEPLTQLIGKNIAAIAAGVSVILDGVPGAGKYRRSGVTIDNLDAAGALTLFDEDGNVAGYVLPGSSRYVPLSGYLKVENETAGSIGCAIGELWQLNP